MIEVVYVFLGLMIGFFLGCWFVNHNKRAIIKKLVSKLQTKIRQKALDEKDAQELLSYIQSLFRPLM